ncbi:disease resistance protein Roq1-like [Nymphaea colorata]|uniref:disease resistance protein Roq1-like n=1 Tax=Nymphaea colorata TaxID=210225 RepID=UPI00214ECD6C|nr:disease resistance protein Roq1-like [Nymphaea colorata]
MEGATEEKGVCFHGCGADGTEGSWQASQGDDGQKFDVFLSFRGADTRKGFIGHLYDALVTRGISTFIDNVNLEKGESVNNFSGLIIPVFFGVEPSVVEKQEGLFLPAFQKHEKNEKLKEEMSNWKNVLREVGKILGFNLKDANEYALSQL